VAGNVYQSYDREKKTTHFTAFSSDLTYSELLSVGLTVFLAEFRWPEKKNSAMDAWQNNAVLTNGSDNRVVESAHSHVA